MNADNIRIEWDEDGCYLWLTAQREAGEHDLRFRISDPEALYDHVKAAIGPWLYERDLGTIGVDPVIARAVYDPQTSDAYDISDPKPPDFHSVHADIWDAREGK